MLSIAVDICETTVLFINVYLPCDNGENYNAFMEYLSKINATIENHSSPYVYVLGDYNANLRIISNKQISSRFGKELKEFCKTENLPPDITVNNSFVTSDHLPVRMELDFLCAHKMQSLKLNKKRTILWSTLTPVDIREYSTKSED